MFGAWVAVEYLDADEVPHLDAETNGFGAVHHGVADEFRNDHCRIMSKVLATVRFEK